MDTMIENNFGLIVKLGTRFWMKLPITVRSWYDIDDFIQDIVVRVLRREHKYNCKYRQTTFVYAVAFNYCKEVLEHFSTKRRSAAVVPIKELEFIPSQLKQPSAERKVGARTAIERLVFDASPELRQTLDLIIRGQRLRKIPEFQAIELKRLATLHSVHVDDFRTLTQC